MFTDRADAGEQLAQLLEGEGVEVDLVLGIPRGGLPVARPVADALGVPLDVIAAKKMGAPNNPELAIGAVASDGSVWRNEDLIDRLDVSETYIEEERERAAASARQKEEDYRGHREPPQLADKRVVIVDDGVATGATATACVRMAVDDGAEYVAFAVPVGSPSSLRRLEEDADDVFAVREPEHFNAVGQFYRSFEQVSDEEAIEYLGGKTPE